MNEQELEEKFKDADNTVVAWCKAHPKATLVMICVAIGVVVGLLLR